MSAEREPKEGLTSKENSFLADVAWVTVHFLTEQNLSDIRTACTGNSNRSEFISINFTLVCLLSNNTNNSSDITEKEEKLPNKEV